MAKFQDKNGIKDAIADVRNDHSDTTFVVTGYVEGSKTDVELKAKGVGGCDDLKSHLKENNCYYCMIRVEEMIDESKTIKFVYIKYLGPKIKPLQRARITTHTQTALDLFKPFHVRLSTTDLDEITDDTISDLVGSASMSKSRVLKNPTSSPQHHGTRRREIKSSVSSPNVSKSALPPKGVSKSVKFQNLDHIKNAIASVRNDEDDTNWMLCGYIDEKLTTIGLIGKGKNGVEELKNHLKDDSVFYGMVRVEDVIDQSITIKFAFIHFMGTKLRPLARAGVSTHKGAIMEHFYPVHVTTFLQEKNDLTYDHIHQLVTDASFSKSKVLDDRGRKVPSPKTTTPKKSPSRIKRNTPSKSNLKFKDMDTIKQAIKDVRNDNNSTKWMLLTYSEDDRNQIELLKAGNGV